MSFFLIFFEEYKFLDQSSQSKKVVNMIWHKHGFKVGPLFMDVEFCRPN
jgi:hypothetical protein